MEEQTKLKKKELARSNENIKIQVLIFDIRGLYDQMKVGMARFEVKMPCMEVISTLLE